MKQKHKKKQKIKNVMMMFKLEDGREKITCKNNAPIKYNLKNKKDVSILDNLVKNFIVEKTLGYTKDLRWIVPPCDPDIVYAKYYKILPYAPLYVPERTFSILGKKDVDYDMTHEEMKEIRKQVWKENTGEDLC